MSRGDRLAHGAVRREGAALGRVAWGLHAVGSFQLEGAGVLSSESMAAKSALRKLGPRDRTRLTVPLYGRAAFTALPSSSTSTSCRLKAWRRCRSALLPRRARLVLGGRERRRAYRSGTPAPGSRHGSGGRCARTRRRGASRAPDQAVDRTVHPDVEDEGMTAKTEPRRPIGQLPGGAGREPASEDEVEDDEGDGHQGDGLQLEADPGA